MPQVELVGILNLTPNSFSDGGQYMDPATAIKRVDELFRDGADIVDIGAEATNPSAEPISYKKEWRRLAPVLKAVLPAYPDLSISLDTRHPETVGRAVRVAQGVKFYVNDVTTFIDPGMIAAVKVSRPACYREPYAPGSERRCGLLPRATNDQLQTSYGRIANTNQAYDELRHTGGPYNCGSGLRIWQTRFGKLGAFAARRRI